MGEEITGFDKLDAKLQSILDQSLAKRNKFVAQQAELLNGRVKDTHRWIPVRFETAGIGAAPSRGLLQFTTIRIMRGM